jgi:hypothetical protein
VTYVISPLLFDNIDVSVVGILEVNWKWRLRGMLDMVLQFPGSELDLWIWGL